MAKVVDFKLKEFIPLDEREEEKPLTWFFKEPDFGMQRIQMPKQKFKLSQLKGMKKRTREDRERMADEMEIDFDFYRQQRETLSYCLRKVENLDDEHGKPVVIPEEIEKRAELIDALPREWMTELYHFIITGEDLELDEEGEDGEPKNAPVS